MEKRVHIKITDKKQHDCTIFYSTITHDYVLSFLMNGKVIQIRDKKYINVFNLILYTYGESNIELNYPSTLEERKKEKIKGVVAIGITHSKKKKKKNSK